MFRPQRQFIKNHFVACVIITLGLCASGIFIYTYYDRQISFTNQFQAISHAKDIETIKHVAEVKTAARLKIKQAAEAKLVAEKSKNATDASADELSGLSCNTLKLHIDPSLIDVLINKKHCIYPLNFAPADLTTVHGAVLSAKAASYFDDLFDAASSANHPFSVTSSYRSYEDQIASYNSWIATRGQADADTYSARPGYSEHQTGFAVDIVPNNQVLSGNTWLKAHAAEYGFIQRYQKGYQTITGYEPEDWHYRFVGVSVALDMRAKGIQTLEEYWSIPGGDY